MTELMPFSDDGEEIMLDALRVDIYYSQFGEPRMRVSKRNNKLSDVYWMLKWMRAFVREADYYRDLWDEGDLK